jgi:Coenzyme PQQ synthesis protein D (PqqD)
MHPDERPVRLTHLWRRMDDRVVILSDATFNLRRFDFNEIGALLWEICDGKKTVRDIIAETTRQFPDADPSFIRTSIESFLNELEKEWLVLSVEELQTYE